jgi:ATP-dependent Lon protease
VKEKVLAAHRAGIRRVLIPKRNLVDLDDVPPDLREEMAVVLVESIDDVLREALPAPTAAEASEGERENSLPSEVGGVPGGAGGGG